MSSTPRVVRETKDPRLVQTVPEATVARGKWRRRSRRGGPRKVSFLIAIPGVLFTLVFVFVADLSGAWYALTDWDGVDPTPAFIGLDNFREIFQTPTARGGLFNTLKLAAAFVVLVNAMGLGLALALNRAVKSRNILRALFFVPAVVTPLAVAYIWQYIFDYGGALNRLLGWIGLEGWKQPWLGDPTWALWTILVVLVWQYSGLAMVIYLAGLQGVPDELMEASAVDGAGAWMRFRRIVLPMLAPAFTVTFTLTLIYGLRVFDQVVALTGGGPVGASDTLATLVYRETFFIGRFGYGSALAVILALVIASVAVTQMLILRAREARVYS